MATLNLKNTMKCLFVTGCFLALGAFTPSGKVSETLDLSPPSCKPLMIKPLRFTKVEELQKCFQDAGYDSVENLKSVPALVVHHLPHNITKKMPTVQRKKAFIQAVLPLILHANHAVRQERTYIKHLQKKESLSPKDQAWLTKIEKKYNVKSGDFKELLSRVDEVPVSMALAQAAIETGWGTSYAVRKKNNLFGVTPPSGVARYKHLEESTHAYLRNLNTHRAYKDMRIMRSAMRKANKPLCAHGLMGKLIHYCEYKGWYVKYVRNMIAKNNLRRFDKVAYAPALA